MIAAHGVTDHHHDVEDLRDGRRYDSAVTTGFSHADLLDAYRAAKAGDVDKDPAVYRRARQLGASHAEIVEAYRAGVHLYDEARQHLAHTEILELATSGITMHDYVLLRHYRATDAQARALLAVGLAGCWGHPVRKDRTPREAVIVDALEQVMARGVPLGPAAELVAGLGRTWEESAAGLVTAALSLLDTP